MDLGFELEELYDFGLALDSATAAWEVWQRASWIPWRRCRCLAWATASAAATGFSSRVSLTVGRRAAQLLVVQERTLGVPAPRRDLPGSLRREVRGVQSETSAWRTRGVARDMRHFSQGAGTGPVPKLDLGYWYSAAGPLYVFQFRSPASCPGGLPGTCGAQLEGRACGHCLEAFY